MSNIENIFWDVSVYVVVFFLILGGYNFWKDFRPEANKKVFGIPAEDIWDIIGFLIAALLLMDSGVIAPIICVILMWKAIRRNRQRKAIEISEAIFNERYEKINEMNREVQFLRHDWKNHLLAITSMIDNKNYDELRTYLGDLQQDVGTGQMDIISGNSMVDSILIQKTNIAKEKQIDIQINCDYMEGIKVSEKDICIILSNLYDNAIEAAGYVKENPWIRINIARNGDMLMMKFSNNYVKKPRKILDKYISEKKDIELHGYGLLSVRNALKKYDGDLDTEYDGDIFIATVTIYDGF